MDRDAARVVGEALYGWARSDAAGATGATGGDDPSPAVAVPSAFVAAQEYGQRLAYALDTYEAQEGAENRRAMWNGTVALVPEIIPGLWGVAAGVIVGYAAIPLGADGTWENPPDTGLVFDAGAAVAEGDDRVDPVASPAEVARQIRAAFERTAGALGDPAPAESPPTDWLSPLLDAVVPEAVRPPGGPGVTSRPPG